MRCSLHHNLLRSRLALLICAIQVRKPTGPEFSARFTMQAEGRLERMFEGMDGVSEISHHNMLVVRYEDLTFHLPEAIRDILKFIDVPEGLHSIFSQIVCDAQKRSLSNSTHVSNTDLVCFSLNLL